MLRLASDADVNGHILDGLRQRVPVIDLARAQHALPPRTPDPEVLAWAAAENRVLITNDRKTMVGFARQRVASGLPLPGLIVTTNKQPFGSAIDDILLVAERLSEDEIHGQIVFLPFRQPPELILSRSALPPHGWPQPSRNGWRPRRPPITIEA